MKSTRTVSKQNIGNSGEYYIASRLSAENFIVTITLGRAEKYDIICVSPFNATYKISVKTRYSKTNGFPLSVKDENGGADDFYYAFVILNEFEREPDFWIVPSNRVNEILRKSAAIYFNEKYQKNGNPHNDVGLRKFSLELNKTSRDLYPVDWEEELEGYYKNLKQLV